ncbi:hypothetical protein CBR_g36950 [Chara braunii]|uniref:Uncharacterized protein n=1 Tax=Chara braunii TaxID=69332 RepID=A0A388JZD6_CHABU|nr:hypothetical protein CBR_g36950 [Chara braunii]|eukprot:GBG63181.1 hypothetical protein CBR_g36950 [Chara braunii]
MKVLQKSSVITWRYCKSGVSSHEGTAKEQCRHMKVLQKSSVAEPMTADLLRLESSHEDTVRAVLRTP